MQTENVKHKKDINKQGLDEIKELWKEVGNFTKNGTNFTIKDSRRIKRIPMFRLVKENGTVVKQKKYGDLYEWKKHLKINKTNRVVGFTPDYVGFRPSSPVFFNNIYVEKHGDFMRIFNKYSKFITDSAANYRETWSGSPDSNTGHLKAFLRDNTNKITTREIFEIIKDCPWFKMPTIDVSNPNEMEYITNFNEKSDPGHYYSRMTKSLNKGYTIYGAIENAHKLYHFCRKFPYKNYALFDLFSREKEIKLESSKEPSTRVVLTTEHHVVLLTSWIFQKFMYQAEHNMSNFYIRGEFDGKKINKILDRFKNYDFIVNPDDDLFDSSNDSQLLTAAGCVMFANSIKTKEDKRLFSFVINSFTQKYVALPPGIVVELNRGNPSGHPGVTAVNCILNMIRWSIVLHKIYGPRYWEKSDLLVYGDDTYIGLKFHENIFNIQEIREMMGFNGDNPLDSIYPASDILYDITGDAPDFLKRKFDVTGIRWNYKKIFDKLLYQSKKRKPFEQVELLVNFYMTAPCDDSLRECIIEWINFCYNDGIITLPEFNKLIKDISKVDKTRFMPCYGYENQLGSYFDEDSLFNVEVNPYHKDYDKELYDMGIYELIWYATESQRYLNYIKKEYFKSVAAKNSGFTAYNYFGNYDIDISFMFKKKYMDSKLIDSS